MPLIGTVGGDKDHANGPDRDVLFLVAIESGACARRRLSGSSRPCESKRQKILGLCPWMELNHRPTA
jgi:hypothetical protein